VRYAWIDKQREEIGLDEMCLVLNVSVSGCRAWKRGGKPGKKRLTDAQMLMLIQSIHAEYRDCIRLKSGVICSKVLPASPYFKPTGFTRWLFIDV
jgi:hypothetical protein